MGSAFINRWGSCNHQAKLETRASHLVKEVDVDFLEAVDGAELVELVVDLVEDQRLVVVGGVVAHDVVHGFEREQVDHHDPRKLNDTR